MKKILAFTAATLVAVALTPAQATPISSTIDLGTVYTGAIPDGTAPWLQAEFSGTAGNKTGSLTLTSLLTGSDFVQGGKNSKATIGWAFYLNPSNINYLSCHRSLTNHCADSIFFGSAANSGPVSGGFNLSFSWAQNNRFEQGDTAIYNITFNSALTASPIAENTSGWSSAAHVQGITSTGQSCSGWVVAGTGTDANGGSSCDPTPSVPEPSTLALMGLALAGMVLRLRRKSV